MAHMGNMQDRPMVEAGTGASAAAATVTLSAVDNVAHALWQINHKYQSAQTNSVSVAFTQNSSSVTVGLGGVYAAAETYPYTFELPIVGDLGTSMVITGTSAASDTQTLDVYYT